MVDFWTWYDAAKAEAEATEAGKAFLAAGFAFVTTGGGCTAWRLELRDGRELLVTDLGGSSVDGSDGWLIGTYGDEDGDESTEFAGDDLAGLFAKAEAYKAT